MKVLQLVPAMREGGVERYVVHANRALISGGWENVVVSAGGQLADRIVADGGRAVTFDLKSKNPLTFLSRARRLERLLADERPDVVCAHSRVPAWLFVAANRRLHLPWITFAHGANSVSAYSRVMTRGDVVTCPSRFVRDYLTKAYGTDKSRFRIIPHAVDFARFDPTAIDAAFVDEKRREWGIEGKRVVMAVGRITRLKGYDTLIRAFAPLAADSKHRDIHLVIVGGTEPSKEHLLDNLVSLATSLGIASRVTFAGAQEKVAECMSLASVVVSSNVAKPEAFGLSMAEALAMDRPVVAKAFGGAAEIVHDGLDGVLVPADSTHSPEIAFAAAIGEALMRRFTGMRERAAARFGEEKWVRSTLSVYEEVAKR